VGHVEGKQFRVVRPRHSLWGPGNGDVSGLAAHLPPSKQIQENAHRRNTFWPKTQEDAVAKPGSNMQEQDLLSPHLREGWRLQQPNEVGKESHLSLGGVLELTVQRNGAGGPNKQEAIAKGREEDLCQKHCTLDLVEIMGVATE
jgi:hypothetical protein